MSKTWKESKAVKQGRSEKGRPKPKMEPYKKGTKNKKRNLLITRQLSYNLIFLLIWWLSPNRE